MASETGKVNQGSKSVRGTARKRDREEDDSDQSPFELSRAWEPRDKKIKLNCSNSKTSLLIKALQVRMKQKKAQKGRIEAIEQVLEFLEEDSFSNLSLHEESINETNAEQETDTKGPVLRPADTTVEDGEIQDKSVIEEPGKNNSALPTSTEENTENKKDDPGNTEKCEAVGEPTEELIRKEEKRVTEISTQTTPTIQRTFNALTTTEKENEAELPKIKVPFIVASTEAVPAPIGQNSNATTNRCASFQDLANTSRGFAPRVQIPVIPQARKLRPIIIDGSNVAMGHGNHKKFSWRGIQICVDYFVRRGHDVKVFLPEYRVYQLHYSEELIKTNLQSRGYLVLTPSRYIRNRRVTPYDDRYIIEYATLCGGVIVSRDRYRDLMDENWAWRYTIENRLIQFTFVDSDTVMFPSDPLGRYGPSLDEILRFS